MLDYNVNIYINEIPGKHMLKKRSYIIEYI